MPISKRVRSGLVIVPCNRRTKQNTNTVRHQRLDEISHRNSGTHGEVDADVQHALDVGVEVDEQRELCDVRVVYAEYTRRHHSIGQRTVYPACDAEVRASRHGGMLRGEDRARQGVAEELLRAVRISDKLARPFAVIDIPLTRREVRVDLAKHCSRLSEQRRMWGTRQRMYRASSRRPISSLTRCGRLREAKMPGDGYRARVWMRPGGRTRLRHVYQTRV